MNKTLFYANLAFDRAVSDQEISPKILRAEKHFEPILCSMFDENYSVLSSVKPNSDYFDYLKKQGISIANISNDTNAFETGEAWAVSQSVIDFYASKNINYNAPNIDVVQKINSREFEFSLNKKLNNLLPNSCLIKSIDDYLNAVKNIDTDFVLKPNFGSAGSGFIFANNNNLKQGEVQIALDKYKLLLLEPFMDKAYDLSSLVEISKDGNITILSHHRNICNKAGAFYANLLAPKDNLIEPFRAELNEIVLQASQEIFEAGYFGRIGFDSMVCNVLGKEKLFAVIDINARHTIASIAHSIYKKRLADKPSMFRFIAKRRLKEFYSYEEFTAITKSVCKEGESIILISPLYINEENQKVTPFRSAFFLQAKSIDDLFLLDDRLRSFVLR